MIFLYISFIAGIVFNMSCLAVEGNIRNYALNADYSINPVANYVYTKDLGDSIQLNDGEYSSGQLWTNKKTVGWKQSGKISISINLSKSVLVKQVCINTARGKYADVFYPSNVEVFLSNDNQSFKYIGNLLKQNKLDNGKYEVHKFCIDSINTDAEHVLLLVRPSGYFGYFFTDEVEVYGVENHDRIALDKYQTYRSSEVADLFDRLVLLENKKRALLLEVGNLTSKKYSTFINRIDELSEVLNASKEISENTLNRYQTDVFIERQKALEKKTNEPLIIWQPDPWKYFSLFGLPNDVASTNKSMSFDLMINGSSSNAFVITNNTRVDNNYLVDFKYDGVESKERPMLLFYEVVPVIANNHKIILDAIKPLNNQLVHLRAGESKQVWMTASANGQSVGIYSGSIRMQNTGNPQHKVSIPVSVKVWNILFPDKQNLSVNAWAYFNWGPIRNIKKLAAEDLDRHHINISLLHPSQIPWPVFEKDGTISMDYSKSDEIMNLQNNNIWLFYLEFNNPYFRTFGGEFKFLSAQWKHSFAKWIKMWKTHLIRKGYKHTKFAFYPYDEPVSNSEINGLVEVAKIIKSIDNDILVYTTLGKLSGTKLAQASRYIDIFQVVEKDIMTVKRAHLDKGKRIWSYTTDGGKSSPPIRVYRQQGWTAFEQDISGIGFWAYAADGWRGSVWNDFDARSPDYSVVYENSTKYLPPISSKRWEAWREGVEDYELLRIVDAVIKDQDERVKLMEKVKRVLNEADGSKVLFSVRNELLEIGSR